MKSVECKVCKSNLLLQKYKYNLIKKIKIFECKNCKSFYAIHNIVDHHKKLHFKKNNSTYSSHYDTAQDIFNLLKNKFDKSIIYKYYRNSPKHKFILDQISIIKRNLSILEIGCSSGHFVASLRGLGYDAYGMDISENAVSYGEKKFGNYFFTPETLNKKQLTFDLIIILGTIGCVEDPIKFIEQNLKYLKDKNSFILLNAANREYLDYSKERWVSTLPPDLNILFTPSFWEKREFKNNYISTTSISYLPMKYILSNLKYHLSRLEFEAFLRNIFLFSLFIMKVKIPHPFGILVKIKSL